MRRLCLGIVISFFFFLFTFLFPLLSILSKRWISDWKKEAHESWTPRRQEIRNPFINITSLNNFGQYFLFDSEQQKWFIGGRDMGFWGFHLVGKKSKKWEPYRFFEQQISEFPTDRHIPFWELRWRKRRYPINKRSLREHDFARLGTKWAFGDNDSINRLTAFLLIHWLLDGSVWKLVIALFDSSWYFFFLFVGWFPLCFFFILFFSGGFLFNCLWVAFEKRWYSLVYFLFFISLASLFYSFHFFCPCFMAAWRRFWFFWLFMFLEWKWNGRKGGGRGWRRIW